MKTIFQIPDIFYGAGTTLVRFISIINTHKQDPSALSDFKKL